MPLTIEHHAVMFALLAKHAIEISGEKGKEAILAGMTRYGNERGRRMALNALERGDKLTVLNSQAYGEWKPDFPGQMEFGVTCGMPVLHTYISRCAWCDAWAKHGLTEYGKYYCCNIDNAWFQGFNPEFTGIENIYLNGQILGLTRAEVDTKLESILDFADIGDFVYQPVKTYSSGMFTRLAFSVAVNVEPDILIVDEALSVGDAWFQHKSMARMRQLMESGCTVLFVSHSIDAVRALCDEAIWLEGGTIKMQGNVTDVTNSYMNDVFIENNRITLKNTDNTSQSSQSEAKENITELQQENSTSEPTDQIVPDPQQNIGKVLSLHSKKLKNSAGEEVEFLKQGERFKLEFKIDINQSIDNISVGILLKDQFGQDLTGESFFNTHRHSLNFKAGQQPTFSFESSMMLRGGQSYSVAMRVNKVSRWDRSDNVIIYADELAMVFDVLTDNDNPMWFKFQMPFKVECQ